MCRFWYARDQSYRINTLSWFIKKSEVVEESKPREICSDPLINSRFDQLYRPFDQI